MVKLHMKIKVNNSVEKKLDQIGKVVTDRMKLLLEGNVGHSTPLSDSIKYRVEKNKVIIYTDNKILTYLEEGTKPHKIRAKNGKSLAFRAQNSGKRKDGSKFSFGDKMLVKEVNHPGTDPKPFFSPGFFLSKHDIEAILKGK